MALWKIVLNPSNPHNSQVYYKDEAVALLVALKIEVDVQYPIPLISFTVAIRDIEIVTKDDPPPGV